jgi:hypothetical protein
MSGRVEGLTTSVCQKLALHRRRKRAETRSRHDPLRPRDGLAKKEKPRPTAGAVAKRKSIRSGSGTGIRTPVPWLRNGNRMSAVLGFVVFVRKIDRIVGPSPSGTALFVRKVSSFFQDRTLPHRPHEGLKGDRQSRDENILALTRASSRQGTFGCSRPKSAR